MNQKFDNGPSFDVEAEKITLTEWLADEYSRMPAEDRAYIVEHMIGRADPVQNILSHEPPEYFIDARTALRYVDSFHVMNGRFGWLDRNAKFWSCAWGAHERLCRFFGWDEKLLEKAGWVRIAVAERGYFTMRRSKKQIKWMEEHKITHEFEEDADILPIPTIEFKP